MKKPMSLLPTFIRKLRRVRRDKAQRLAQLKKITFYEHNHRIQQSRIENGFTPSVSFVDRIKKSYRLPLSKVDVSDASMWSHIDEMRRPVHEALMVDDDSAHKLLSDPGSTNLFFGLDDSFTANIKTSGQLNDFDKIVRLSEALGCRRFYNPESELLVKYETLPVDADVDVEVERICSFIGIPKNQSFKNPFRNTFGIETQRGLLDQRTIQSLYQAYRIKSLGGNHVIEIGGGLGRTAYYSLILGATSYAIVDIPLTHVCQALFLGYSIGEDNVRMVGEPDTGQKIQLFSPVSLPESKFDVAFSSDSLTEMAIDQAEQYVDYIKAKSPIFLSLNHEANSFTVASLFPPANYRYPYWLRKGYVEEVFTF